MRWRSLGEAGRKRTGLGRAVLWLVRLRGTPEAIASGLAIGVFVAFTPTVGFQMAISALLATILNANRTAAVAAVWITNPLTMAPIYVCTYWVGSRFWTGPPVAKAYQILGESVRQLVSYDVWQIYKQFMALFGIHRDIFVPLVIGGVLVGMIGGLTSYLVVVGIVRTQRRIVQVRRRRRASRSAEMRGHRLS